MANGSAAVAAEAAATTAVAAAAAAAPPPRPAFIKLWAGPNMGHNPVGSRKRQDN